MSRRCALLLLLFAFPAILLAQVEDARDRASLGFSGPVRFVKESIYLSHHFKVKGLRFKEAEKSVLTGFSELHFDSAGWLTVQRLFQESPFRDQTDSFTFDSRQRLVGHQWQAGGRSLGRTEHRYNLIGQRISFRQYDDTGAFFCETAYRYRGGLLSEEKTYSRTHAIISETHYTYDSLKRLVREEALPNPYRYSIPYVKEYAYDGGGNLCMIRYVERGGENRWTYRRQSDASGKMLSESTYDAADSLTRIHTFKYNRRGQVVAEMADDGRLKQEIRYSYRHGRLEWMQNRFGDTDFRTFYLRYDEWGNWVEKADFDGINLQVTTREITYGDQPLKMKKTAPSRQSPAQR